MRILKIIGASIGVLLVSLLLFIGLLVWKSQHPTRPKGWPPGSVYFRPPLRQFLAGFWVGCQLDSNRNVDTCQFADFKGNTRYQGDYTTCDGRPPLPNEKLQLQQQNQAVIRVSLVDGTMLLPIDLCRDFPASPNGR
jgi:hypothetical protein